MVFPVSCISHSIYVGRIVRLGMAKWWAAGDTYSLEYDCYSLVMHDKSLYLVVPPKC